MTRGSPPISSRLAMATGEVIDGLNCAIWIPVGRLEGLSASLSLPDRRDDQRVLFFLMLEYKYLKIH